MKKILLSVQNNLLSEAIQNALVKKGRFCIENVSPNQDGKILDLCIAERVDVLLMDVTRLADSTIEKRLELGYTTLQDSDRDGIPDEYDRYDNRQGRNSGFGSQFDTTNSFSGQNGMLDVPLALQPYVRDTNTSSSPQRISSLKAKFIVNHPFITDISMYVDSSIGTVRNELMRAFDDGMQLMRLCEQIRNGMQNNMGYQQNGMPMQSNTVNQQVSQPFTPQNAAAIVCSACGYKPDGNPPKFCPFCGAAMT